MRILYALQNTGGIDLKRPVGDAIPVLYTLRGLAARGHAVTLARLAGDSVTTVTDFSLLTPDQYCRAGVSGLPLYRRLEGGVRRLQGALRLPYFALFDSLRFYQNCVRLLPQFELCHEHIGLFGFGAPLAARRTRTPYILTFSADPIMELALVSQPLNLVQRLLATMAARLGLRTARTILCVSEAAKRQLVDHWQINPDKIAVMPNGVDLSLFSPELPAAVVRTRLGIDQRPVLMFVGSFQHWHGLAFLVDLFAELVCRRPQLQLVLVGDGPVRPAIEQQIAQHNLQSHVTITGRIPHTAVADWLSVAAVVTLPYPRLPHELWFSPLKLYEYMAAAKAIVATDDGQIAEVIDDGVTGILLPPEDKARWLAVLLQLLDNPADCRQLGKRARTVAEQRHSWASYILRLEHLYERTLQNTKDMGLQ